LLENDEVIILWQKVHQSIVLLQKPKQFFWWFIICQLVCLKTFIFKHGLEQMFTKSCALDALVDVEIKHASRCDLLYSTFLVPIEEVLLPNLKDAWALLIFIFKRRVEYIFGCYYVDTLVRSEEFLKSGNRRFQLLSEGRSLAHLVDELLGLLVLQAVVGTIDHSDPVLERDDRAHQEVHLHKTNGLYKIIVNHNVRNESQLYSHQHIAHPSITRKHHSIS
jgi:hypothetical protein